LLSFNYCLDQLAQDQLDRLLRILPYGRYLIADYPSDLLFPIAKGRLPWQPNSLHDLRLSHWHFEKD